MRVAIGGFHHETNSFAPSRASYDDFARGGGWPALVSGGSLLGVMDGVNIPISGFIEEAKRLDWELVPLSWASASPSAHVTRDAYERIVAMIIDGLRKAMPVDAVYLCLHGAMMAEHVDDGEGALLTRVRAMTGPAIPVVASLDLHANVTAEMFAQSDGLVAYRTYPHIDMAETGWRTARYLRALTGARGKSFRRVPFLIPITSQCTDLEPARGLYDRLRWLEEQNDKLFMSFCPGFPAADFPECGPTVAVYAEDSGVADKAADALVAEICAAENKFSQKIYSPKEAVREAIRLAEGPGTGPVVIADTQDNPGGGGDGDTMGMLRALREEGAKGAALGLVIDPDAARAAHEAGVGAWIDIRLGGKSGIEGDSPCSGRFRVVHLADGSLVCRGPFYAGVRMELGLSAGLEIDGIGVAVASRKVQMADRALFRFVGIEPEERAILVNKSSVHFRADFAPIARAILVAAAPGPVIVNPAEFPWRFLPSSMRR